MANEEIMRQSLIIGGIELTLHSCPSLQSTSRKVAVLFLLHGRTGSAKDMDSAAFKILQRAYSLNPTEDFLDLVTVSIDQRNHGSRTVQSDRNGGWREKQGVTGSQLSNGTHALDMYAIQLGTAKDVSFLIDFLEPYMYPAGERVVEKYMVMGMSLGGHAAWIALSDPRITLGIPIIGSPDYHTLMSHRATNSNPPIPFAAPIYPALLEELIKKVDPVNLPSSVWRGKDILILSAKKDRLVNFYDGGGDAFFQDLKKLQEEGVGPRKLELWVQEGKGHQMTDEMVDRAAEFVSEAGLRVTLHRL